MPTDLDTSRAHHLVHQGRLGWSSRLSDAWHLKAKNFVDSITEKFFLRITNDVCEMEAQKIVSKMNNRGDLPWYRRFGTKNIGYARAVARHGAVMRPDLESFEGSKATFVDGSTFEDVDVVVLCTLLFEREARDFQSCLSLQHALRFQKYSSTLSLTAYSLSIQPLEHRYGIQNLISVFGQRCGEESVCDTTITFQTLHRTFHWNWSHVRRILQTRRWIDSTAQ